MNRTACALRFLPGHLEAGEVVRTLHEGELGIGRRRGAGTMAAGPAVSRRDDTAAIRIEDHACVGTGVRGTAALWRAVDLDVSRVIGRRATAAVLRRALVLARRTHGWMPEPADGASLDECVRALAEALGPRRPEESRAGRRTVEARFHDLLSSLVGPALAAQLLQAAWAARPCERAP